MHATRKIVVSVATLLFGLSALFLTTSVASADDNGWNSVGVQCDNGWNCEE